MIGWFHPELRPEAWVSPVLIPEGWMGRDFIGEGEGGEEPPPASPSPAVVLGGTVPGAGYIRIRRRLWFRVT